MIINPEKYAHEYELDAKSMIDCGEESAPVSIVSMRLWLRAAHAVVELTGPSGSDGKTFGSDGSVSLWLHESDLALGNLLLNRISSENAKLRELCSKLAQVVANDDVTFRKLREIAKRELGYDFIGAYDSSLGDMDQLPLFSDHMRELGVEVEG